MGWGGAGAQPNSVTSSFCALPAPFPHFPLSPRPASHAPMVPTPQGRSEEPGKAAALVLLWDTGDFTSFPNLTHSSNALQLSEHYCSGSYCVGVWAVFFSFVMSQPSQSFRVGKRGLRLHTDRCLPARSMSIPPAPSPHSPPNSLCSDTAPAALSPCSSSSSHCSHFHCLHFTVSLSTTPRGTHFHLGPVAKGLLIFPDACSLSPSPALPACCCAP